MSLSELLQWAGLGQKTGTLAVSAISVEKKIFFSEGRILSSSSSDPREYLGHFLVSHGYISEEELAKAMQVQEESKILLGKILVMIGAISEQDLMRLMRLKVEESIYDVFLWPDGEFRFADDELPEMKMVPLSVDVTGIIMEGLRRWDEWKRIREKVPTNGAIPVLLGPVATDSLSEHANYILPYINGRRSIEEIAVQTHNAEFHVAKLVYDLMTNGIAQVELPAAASASPPPPPPSSGEIPASSGDDVYETETLLARARSALAQRDSARAWKTLRTAVELDPQSAAVKEAVKETEKAIMSELAEAGIGPARIPALKIPIGEITQMNFSPNEGFVLSRISGNWDIKSILKISPIREIDALLIFKKLLDDGIIVLK